MFIVPSPFRERVREKETADLRRRAAPSLTLPREAGEGITS
jgi:hypothetical protein